MTASAIGKVVETVPVYVVTDKFTLAIALVGCITGVMSLFVVIYKTWSEKPRLKAELHMPHMNGFFWGQDHGLDYPCVLAVVIRLSNNSAIPITLRNIRLDHPDEYHFYTEDIAFPELRHNRGDGTIFIYSFPKGAHLPITIQAGEVAERTFVFEQANYLQDETVQNPNVQLKIVIGTSAGAFSVKFRPLDLTGRNIYEYIQDNQKRIKALQ